MNKRQIEILEIFSEAAETGTRFIPRKQKVLLPLRVVVRNKNPIKPKKVKYKTIRPIPYRLTQKALDYF